jgi:hypothetical protein
MIERGIQELTGQTTAPECLAAVIPGYTAGKKIGIKVNINNGSIGNVIDAVPAPIIGVITGSRMQGLQNQTFI